MNHELSGNIQYAGAEQCTTLFRCWKRVYDLFITDYVNETNDVDTK